MLRNRLLSICAVLACVFALSALPSWGQAVSTGTITGTVTDNTGAVVVGASVTLTDKATGDTRTTATNETGHYVFQNVNPSSYIIKFKKSGFAELDVTDATVRIGTQLNENVQMKLGAISTTVTVTETVGAELQTMNATVGTTLGSDQLSSLPATQRDVSTFLELQPGVSPDGSVAGAVVDQSTFLLDGGQNTNDMDGSMGVYTPSFAGDPTGGVNTFNGQPTGVMPTPIDSIEELKVNTAGQTADFNTSAGAQVEMVTKRGTNQWHGTAYDYYLDNNFSANSWTNIANGTPVPSYHFSRFGGAGGGPIIPKEILGGKTYFFGNYEGWRYPQSQTFTRAVPSEGMRLGLLQAGGAVYNINPYAVTYPSSAPAVGALVPGTTYPASAYDPRNVGINPVVQTMWQTYEPAPNAGCAGLSSSYCDSINVLGFSGNMLTPQRQDFAVARLDHDFGPKWHWMSSWRYFRFTRATTSQVDIGGALPGDKLGVPTSVASRPQNPWYFVTGLTTNVTSNVTNDFHFSYLRNFWAWETANAPPQPGTSSSGVLEPFGESNGNVLAPYNVNAQNVRTRFWDGKDYFFRDDVTVLHGNHLFQFGGQYQRNWNFHQRTDNGGGINFTLTYQLGDSLGAGVNNSTIMDSIYNAGFAGGLAGKTKTLNRDLAASLGIVTESQIAYTRSGPNLTLNAPLTPAQDKSTIPYYNVYFSDSWHLKPSITLTYGIGYTIEMPPTEQLGRQVEVVDAGGQLLDAVAYIHQKQAAALKGEVYNPTVGFALVGNTGAGRKYPYDPFYGSFSPRVAVAWNPHFESGSFASRIFGENSSVIRGGYNRVYGRLNGVDLVLVPLLGTGLIQPVQCLNALASGICGSSADASTAFRIGVDGNTAPLAAATATLPQPVFPGINNVAAGAGEGFDTHFRPNVVDSFDFTYQRQFGPKMIMELGYIGRRITHEYQPINLNAVPYMMTMGGQRFDAAYAAIETALGCATSVVACGASVPSKTLACSPSPCTPAPNPAYTNYFNSLPTQAFFENAVQPSYCTGSYAGIAYASCTAAVAFKQVGNLESQSVWSLWSKLDNGNFVFPRTMQNTPINCITGTEIGCSGQLTSGVGDNASIGYGNYNGAFVTFRTNDWHGLTTSQNFTWSKALGTGAFVQATSEYAENDPFNLGRMYGLQNWDRKFVYNLVTVYNPPFYKGQEGAIGRVLGGWSISPIFATGSGLPVYCNTNSDAQAFGSADGSDYFTNEQCILTKTPQGISGHLHVASDPNYGVNGWTDPQSIVALARAPILGLDNHDNGVGLSNLRGFPYWNVDLSITKNVKITERVSTEFQAVFYNVLNHNQYGDPYLDISATDQWGTITSQANNPRQMQFGLRVRF